MSKIKRHSILILMAMLVLFLLPISFAADDDAGDVVGITDSDGADSLSVDEVSIAESSSQDDVISAGYDYETTVTPSTVDYTKGNSTEITIKTDVISDPYYDYDSTLSGYDFYAYIGGENSNPVKINIPTGWTYKNMKFNLAQISDYLNEGENKVYFHHSLDENIFKGGYLQTTKFNPLTVNVVSVPSYVTTPTPANVYFYNIGDSKKVNVTVDYDDYWDDDLSYYTMYVYINGEETSNRVAIDGVKANAKNFTFDLASISNKLVEGVNNLTFHPNKGSLEGTFTGPYLFNTLKVDVKTPAGPSYDYVSTPSPTSVDYAIGESLIINVNATYLSDEEDPFNGFDLSGDVMYVYVNGSGVRIESVNSESKSFKVDLKDIGYDFDVNKTYSLVFHPANGILSYENVDLSNCQFNPLTVNVKEAPLPTITYEVNITDPASGTINYVKGNESVKISVQTNYNSTTMKALDNSKMYAYINGNLVGIVNSTFNTEVRGSATTFSFYLTQFDDYLTKATNTIIFHPNETFYADTNITDYNYQTLTVKIVGEGPASEIKYRSTPTVNGSNSTQYLIGDHKNVLVTVDCDLLDQFESYDKLLAWVGETSYDINMMANEGTVTVDLYNVINKNYFEEGKTYTIYFHPDIDDLNIIGIKDGEYEFNPLTVEIIGTYTPEATVVYNSTPKADGKNNINYNIAENTTVTVTVEYSHVTYPSYLENNNMFIFINGEGAEISDVKANATSFTINLADYIASEGKYNISFHPNDKMLEWAYWGVEEAVFVFNNLTVTAVNKTQPASDSFYVSTPSVDNVTYVKGESLNVTFTLDYPDDFDIYYMDIGVYINGSDEASLILPVNYDVKVVTFDLKDLNDKFEVGKSYSLVVGHSDEMYQTNENKNPDYQFNALKVTVKDSHEPSSDYDYESFVTPNVTDYTRGESLNVTVTAVFNDTLDIVGYTDMCLYINGNETAIKVGGVDSGAKSFIFDLADISDKLLDGGNTIVFHCPTALLDDATYYSGTYKFNPLTVNVKSSQEPAAEGNVTYTTTPNPASVDYTLGESSTIDVAVEYNSTYSDVFGSVPLYVLINNNESIEIAGIKANVTSFKFDLKDISDYLAVGKNNVSFIVKDDVGIENVVYEFNNLAVNAVSAHSDSNLTYVSTPNPSKVFYTLNESSIVTVTVDYSDLFEESLQKDVIMFVYVNGEELRNRVKIDGVAGNAKSFEFDLKTVSDRLVEGQNNLTFHPHPKVLENIQAGPYTFNPLTVIAKSAEPIKDNVTYSTTPTPSEIDYTLGESSSVDVAVKFNSTYSKEFGSVPLYVLINNVETIEMAGIKANATSFSLDLKSISDYLAVGQNTVAFIVKDDVGIENVVYEFNNLTVNAASAPVNPNSTYVSTPSPSKVIYTPNESSIITVTITYSDLFEERMPEEASMFVYINGEDIANRVKIEGVAGNATSFEFDLKTISDRLVDGQNNLTFHPHPGALEGIQVGPYTFNPLIVLVNTAPEPVNPEISAYDGIIYVSLSGNETNDGSINSPVNTIAKAIELASSENNKEHKIVILEGTYTEHDLSISTPLDISAEGNVVIDAQQLGRIFDVTAKANISGITFKNGKSSEGAAILWNADDGRLTNSKFINNSGRNAVVKVGKYSSSSRKITGQNMIIDNCSFDANTNVIYGNCMAVDIEEGTTGVKILNSNFTNHKGEFGSEHGVLYIKGDNNLVDGCLFENNTMGMAAAIQIDGENNIITNSRFINNKVANGLDSRSGAIELQGPNKITNNVFINNGGQNCNQGGAIDIVYATSGGDIVISNNRFINNSAVRGAAIYVDGGAEDRMKFDSLTIDNNTFEANNATYGSCIYTTSSNTPIDITNNKFKDNIALNDSNIFAELTRINLDGNEMENGGIELYYGEIGTNLTLNITAPRQVAVGETVNVTATLTDDMGNPVSGTSVNITANGELIKETPLENGIATVEFTAEKLGEYIISGINEFNPTVNTATINVVVNATIEIPDISGTAGETITVPVKVSVDGKSVETGVVNVTVDGKTIEVPVTNGTANVPVTLPNEPGKYNITVSYDGVEQTKEFTVVSIPEKSASIISITIEENNITGILKDASGAPIANAAVDYVINGKTATVTTDSSGAFKIEAVYDAAIDISFAGDNATLPYRMSVTLKDAAPAPVVVKADSKFNIPGVITIRGYAVDTKAKEEGIYYATELLDANGNPIKGAKIQFAVNDKIYKRTTNEKGSFNPYKLNMIRAGRYTMAFYFPGDDSYNGAFASVCVDLDKKPIKIKASNKSYKANVKTKKYTVTLSTIVGSSHDGKAHLKSGLKVTLTVNGKTFTGKTNSKGKITFKITNLKNKAKYKAKISYAGDSTYKSASKTVTLTIK